MHLATSDEMAEASRDLSMDNAEETTHRFSIAAQARDQAGKSAKSADSAGIEGEEELRNDLRSLHERQIWIKKSRKKPSAGS